MDEVVVDIDYSLLMKIILDNPQYFGGDLEGWKTLEVDQLQVMQVEDKPSKFLGNDRISITIERM